MVRVLGARLLDAVPTVLLVLTLVFVALRLLPGDPALVALGEYATPEQLALFRRQMGLDVPLWRQYVVFVWDMLTLDFGQSLINRVPVVQLIGENLPYTIELTIVATAWASSSASRSASSRRSTATGCRTPACASSRSIGYAIPDFYLGALLLIVFALNLGWFPINGGGERVLRPDVSRLPAGVDARDRQVRLHRPADADLAARGARQGLHPHRTGQGRAGEPRHLPARSEQRAAADRDRASASACSRRCPAPSPSSSSSTGRASARS